MAFVLRQDGVENGPGAFVASKGLAEAIVAGLLLLTWVEEGLSAEAGRARVQAREMCATADSDSRDSVEVAWI